MKTTEIIDQLEDIIEKQKDNLESIDSKAIVEDLDSKKTIFLSLQFLINLVKNPFEMVSKYLKEEVIPYAKKDAGLFMLIMGMFVALFVFFFVFWLFISAAVGIYFYEQGSSLFTSIMLSILFQFISSLLAILTIFIASKNLKSLKLFIKLKDYANK